MAVEELEKRPKLRGEKKVVELPGFDLTKLAKPSRRFETSAGDRKERRVEDLAQEEKNQLLAEFLKDPENQKAAGRMALELGLGVGAAYATGGASVPWTAARTAALRGPRIAALGTRMLATGTGEGTGSLISETFDPSEKPLKEAAIAFGTGALGEYGGSAIARLRRGGTALEEGGREAVEQLTEQGGAIAPGLVSTSRAVDIPQNIAESSLFGGGVLVKMKERGVELATAAVDNFVGAFKSVAKKEDMEDLVRDTLVERSDAFRTAGRALYSDFDAAVKATGKEVRPDLTRFMDQLAAQANEFGNEGARRVLSEVGRLKKLGDIAPDGTASFAIAQDIRSALLGIGRQGQDLIASGAQVTGKRLAPVVDRAMSTAANEADPALLPLFRDASKFWKDGAKRFNSRLMKSLTKEDPRAVFDAMGRNPKAIREVRHTIDSADTWREVQGQFLVDVVEKSSDEVGVISGRKLLGNLKRFGQDALDEMFSKTELDTLRQYGRTLQLAQGRTGKNLPGGIFIQLQQAGAITQTGGFVLGATGALSPGTAASIVVGPAIMAKILSVPAVSRYLTIGLNSKPGSQRAIRAFGQIVAWLAKEGISADSVESGSKSNTQGSSLRFSATLQGPGTEKPLSFGR